MSSLPGPAPSKRRAFSALRAPGFAPFLFTYWLTMMADNIEHVISYWVAHQKFHSPALGGFAVISHWLPFLALSVPVGALNDRFDSRRLIQIGMALFMFVSVGWGYFFYTDSLTEQWAMALLVLHGCAGVFWGTSSQVLLYDIVGPAELPGAVRLYATARYLGVLVGPAVGGFIMLGVGPTHGIWLNTLFYLPPILWLLTAPYGRHFRGDQTGPKRAVRGLADILQTIEDVRPLPVLSAMIVLAGGASFFVGNSYQAQMPGFAELLGHGDPGVAYSALLAADAAGALCAGLLLELRGGVVKPAVNTVINLALGWAVALCCFAAARSYPLALLALFAAGFCELSFSSMAQALVQLGAPDAIRGRVIGLFNMSALGLRMFSGVLTGLVGAKLGTHAALAGAALGFAGLLIVLRLRTPPLRAGSA